MCLARPRLLVSYVIIMFSKLLHLPVFHVVSVGLTLVSFTLANGTFHKW